LTGIGPAVAAAEVFPVKHPHVMGLMPKPDKKQPWFKFYPVNWRGDERLRLCSLSARGLWIDLISYMHEGDPYGHMTLDGEVPSIADIASLVARPLPEVKKALAELKQRKVCGVADGGALFSRKMVRDKAKEEQDRANGKGGGNPKIINQVNAGVNPQDNQKMKDVSDRDYATETRERGTGTISPEAFELTGRLERACGYALPEDIPPGWFGCAMWAQKCLDDGWVPDVMVESARAVALRKGSSIGSFKYLEKPLAEAMAEHRKPLPVIEERQPEKVTVIANGKSETLAAVAARLAESGVTFGERPRGLRAEESGDNVRLLSKG
jgi:hypothetical protein